MLLEKLYETQRKVDEKIAEKLPEGRLDEWDNLANRAYAFKVEVSELANEIGFFKEWKHSHVVNKDSALEELADCLAFLLSVGITQGYDRTVKEVGHEEYLVDASWLDLFKTLDNISLDSSSQYRMAFMLLLTIGNKLGATEDVIAEVYKRKSSKNIERQEKGY